MAEASCEKDNAKECETSEAERNAIAASDVPEEGEEKVVSQEGPAASELTPPPPVTQEKAPSAPEPPSQAPMLTRAALVEMLHQQLKAQTERQVEEASLCETRELLQLLDPGSASRVWPLHDFNRDAEVSDPEISKLLQADVDALSLQLRCNLATEDRPHLGRFQILLCSALAAPVRH
eukprot:1791366-Rhodomonas_salina.1